MSIYPTITINGVSSNTIAGLLITSLPPISKPLQRTLVDVIDGRAGDVVTPLGFAAYDKPVGIALTTGYDINEVIAFFNSAGVVTFSNEPDKYYKFAIYDQIDFERLIRFKTATVIFHVQPYKYANNENPLNFAITSGEPVSVTNSGNTDSMPDLIITGEGVVNLDINGEQVLNIDFGEDEQAYIIDSEAMNAYAAENAIKDVKTEFSASQASGTPTPSSPILITPVNSVKVTRAGKNLLDENERTDLTNNIQFYNENGLMLKAGTYTWSTSESINWYVADFATTTNLFTKYHSTFLTFTLNEDTRVKFNAYKVGIDHNNKFQLETGSTATAYEAYNGVTKTLALGGDYYGGSVDAVTGKITLTHQLYNTLGDNISNVVKDSSSWRVYYSSAVYGTDNQYKEGLCDKLGFKTSYNGVNGNNNSIGFPSSAGTQILIRNDALTSAQEVRDFMPTLNVVYPLATPIVVYASNTAEIQAVLGVNNIFSDAGDVEVTYKAGGAIHTETGEIVTFTLTPEDYERGAFVNRQIVGNYDNIKLKSGANTISLTGNATSLTVDKYSRWI